MIRYTNDYKTLVVPSSLGNFPSNGGGSGSGVTEQEVYDIVNSAITEYDIEEEVELEDIRENVSGNTEDIQAISATTESMAGSITAITASMDNLSGAVTSLTEGLEALSAATQNMGSDVDGLSGATQNIQSDVETLSGQTSAILGDLAALSASTVDLSGATVNGLSGANQAANSAYTLADSAMTAVGELSGVTQDVYDAIFYEEEGETYSQIDDLWGAVNDKQDALSFQSGLTEEEGVVRITPPGRGISLSEGGRLQLNMGSGVTIGDDNELNVKIGEGLAFSGDTIVVSGGTGGGPEVYLLNKLSQQELLDLYDLIKSYYDDNTSSFTSAWTEDAYAFYIDLREYNDQQTYNVADHYEGFFPMTVARCHPSDYGGAVMFTGVEGDRDGNGHLINIRFVIASDGTTDVGTWWNSPSSDPTMQYNLRITSGGTIENDQDWSAASDSNNAGRLVMQYYESTPYGDLYSEGKVKWVNMYPTTYNGETKWYYMWSADIVIGTTLYTGVWGMIQDQWYASSDVPPQTLSWTSGATYESQTYPSLL